MFTTCLHCTAHLGRNEAFETFPVGTRLAFDAARGRLWVVCRACDRWNLSPLEERWETVEAAERRFRDSRLRVSTDHIGLARLREGVDLIRIGDPQRPEMAAWRYGDQFGRRRKRQMLATGAVVGSAAAIVGGVLWIGAGVGSFVGVWGNGAIWDALIHGRQSKSIGLVSLDDGRRVNVQRRHARMSALEHGPEGAPLQLRLESVQGTHVLTGEAAMRATARLMPTVNRFGGKPLEVRDAVGLLEWAGDPLRLLSTVQQQHGMRSGQRWSRKKSPWTNTDVRKLAGTLHAMPPEYRLALEMALHEESERKAMEGELADLEQAWRDAETIAKIADDMFVPDSIEQRAASLRTHDE